MSKPFSVYLDLVRFLASFIVLLHHARDILDLHLYIAKFGHEAVVVFFILSGYVISYVAAEKEKTLTAFAISRITRIYSVAIPAILLTGLLDMSGYLINHAPYVAGKQAWDHAGIRIISSLLFTGEIWTLSIQLFSNVPYWSLNYEVWYYVGFAVLAYVGGKKSWLLFTALCLFIGPKLLLLMPLWWTGVYLHKSKRWRAIRPVTGYLLVTLSALGFFFYAHYSMGALGTRFSDFLNASGLPMKLDYSAKFAADYFFGLVVALHFLGMRALCDRHPGVLLALEKPIRIMAAATFTMYLLHQPLLLFFQAVYYSDPLGKARFLLILLSTLLSIFFLNALIERYKGNLKRAVSWAFEIIRSRMAGIGRP